MSGAMVIALICLPRRSPGLHTISFADGLTLDLFDYYAASLVEADQILFAGPGDDALIGEPGRYLHGGTGSSV